MYSRTFDGDGLMVLRSEQLNELFTALAKAQAEMESAFQTGVNPHYKSRYAKLADLVKASRPALTKNGLSVSQDLVTDDGKEYLLTILAHSSGQYKGSKVLMRPAKNDEQSFGKCTTYMSRYAYQVITGVVVCDDLDDDGNENSGVSSKLTEKQISTLYEEIKGYPEVEKYMLDGYGIPFIEEIPAQDYDFALNKIRERKQKVSQK